jgi:uncharacterized protein YlbG (UPF0298 family)
MHELIGEAVDMCVYIRAKGKTRRITQVAKVHGYDSRLKRYELEYVHNEEPAA